MKKKVVIFGSGKTGRGFAAHLTHLGGFSVILVDRDKRLVDDLIRTGRYDIQVLGNQGNNCTIFPEAVYHIQDEGWIQEFSDSSLGMCSVFGNNLEDLSKFLAKGIKYRRRTNPDQAFNFITCENYAGAASFLRERLSDNLDNKTRSWLNLKMGISESIILSTCIGPTKDQDPLTIRAQNFFELPCDGEAFKGELPGIYGLKPLSGFSNQLRRKIYTYNCINAVITYLGSQAGYNLLSEAGNDPDIVSIARKAARESSDAQIAEYAFDRNEQHNWEEAAFRKFADVHIPDTISRNGADPEENSTGMTD